MGLKFILGACRATFKYAARFRLPPPCFENPFAALPIDRPPIEHAKPIHVFSGDEEADFPAACDDRRFPARQVCILLWSATGCRTIVVEQSRPLNPGDVS